MADRPRNVMGFRRTLADILMGSSGWPCRARHETVPSTLAPLLTSENSLFWQRDPKNDSSWWFSPPDRYNGHITYFFDQCNDSEYPCVQPILTILANKFDAEIQLHFSPYNSPYTIIVEGFKLTLVEDNCPCPYLSMAECDGLFLEDLINRLRTELAGTD